MCMCVCVRACRHMDTHFLALERMMYISEMHEEIQILSFAYIKLGLLSDIQEWFFRVFEKMRGADGLLGHGFKFKEDYGP